MKMVVYFISADVTLEYNVTNCEKRRKEISKSEANESDPLYILMDILRQ